MTGTQNLPPHQGLQFNANASWGAGLPSGLGALTGALYFSGMVAKYAAALPHEAMLADLESVKRQLLGQYRQVIGLYYASLVREQSSLRNMIVHGLYPLAVTGSVRVDSAPLTYGDPQAQARAVAEPVAQTRTLGSFRVDGWRVSGPLPVLFEQDSDGTHVVSDDVSGAYGRGVSVAEAWDDYLMALGEYLDIVSADRSKPLPASLQGAFALDL